MGKFYLFLKKSCVTVLLVTMLFGMDTLAAPAKQDMHYVTACAFASTGRGPAVCINGDVAVSGETIPCNKLVRIKRLRRKFSVQTGGRISFRMEKPPYVTSVTYRVSKPAVAKVNKKGVLTGVSPGKTRLFMTFRFEDGTKSHVHFDVSVKK